MMNAARRKVWLSWSSGKDGYAALRHLWDDTPYEVASAFTVIDTSKGTVPMHAVGVDLLRAQTRALGLRHRLVRLDEDPTVGFRALIDDARQNGVTCFAFGDLFLDDVRQYREENMADTGIGTLFPLWQEPTTPLITTHIRSGMRAVITSVDRSALPTSFLGRELTLELVDELVARGCDPCGENGEYHSFVFDGPSFSHPVAFERGEPVIGKEFAHLPLRARTDALRTPDAQPTRPGTV